MKFANTRRSRTIAAGAAALITLFGGAASAGDYSLQVDGAAAASDALASHATARPADVVAALERYFRGEPTPDGRRYDNLIASLAHGVVRYAHRSDRERVEDGLVSVATWGRLHHSRDLEDLLMASPGRRHICRELHRVDASPLSAAVRKRVRRLLTRMCQRSGR